MSGFTLPDRITIGDVLAFNGMPKGNNPYVGARAGQTLLGDERVAALRKFRDGALPSRFEMWFAPAEGGARRLEAEDAARIDWRGLRDD